MNPTSLRNGIRSGTVFVIIIIFLDLIGFTVTGATLVAKLFGSYVPVGSPPDVIMLAIFLGLLGLWAGIMAAKPVDPDTYQAAGSAGLAAGMFTGLVTGIFCWFLGTIYAAGIDMRSYLSNVSPVNVKYFIFNLDPIAGGLILLALFSITGLLGGLLARAMRGQGRRAFSRRLRDRWAQIRNYPFVLRAEKYRWTRLILMGLGLVLLAFLPTQIGSYWDYVIGTVGIYVILGLGLNIIVGLAGQLVLGYVAFFAIGAYSVALLNAPLPLDVMTGFWVALVAAIILSALAGLLIGLPILSLRGDYLAIVTLGLGEIIRILLSSDAMTPFTGGPRGVPNIGGPVIFGLDFSSDIDLLYLILIFVLLTIFISQRIQNSHTGRSWVSIREDETVSKATGVDTFRSKLLALALGAAFAGIGGALFAVRNQFTGPEDHSLMVSINVLALVIVGGMGSIPGVILGAFALKGLPEILRETENYRLLIFGGLLVVMMILRPSGLWPASRQKLEKPGTKVEAIEKAPVLPQPGGVEVDGPAVSKITAEPGKEEQA
jgi:ABC-type branched-subunit amino acid transport system permease subunit